MSRRLTYVLVVVGGTKAAGDAGAKMQLALITRAAGDGRPRGRRRRQPSATKAGTVALVRADDADKTSVATVDNADSALGKMSPCSPSPSG